jgi:hypothetical protein
MHNFSYMFISILCMFRAVIYPSSGELIVSVRHLVYVTLCRWPSSMQVDLHTRRSSTQGDIYQVSQWYNKFSWWWAHGWPKHVENRNKHIRKIVHQFGLFTKIKWIIDLIKSLRLKSSAISLNALFPYAQVTQPILLAAWSFATTLQMEVAGSADTSATN